MNAALGERHLRLARRTLHAAPIKVCLLEDSLKETWGSGIGLRAKENLDDQSAISGDDLARINAFEPKDPDLRSIGRQYGIWSSPRVATGKSPVPGRKLMTMNDENETTPAIEDHL